MGYYSMRDITTKLTIVEIIQQIKRFGNTQWVGVFGND
jgi:hypothetical protein